MPKISKAFFYLTELPVRWNRSLSEIAGWTLAERLNLLVPITPVKCGDRNVAGIVRLPAADVARLFLPSHDHEAPCAVTRIMHSDSLEPMQISEPAIGIEVRVCDLMLDATEVSEFEQVNELLSIGPKTWRPAQKGRRGRPAEYQWEDMLVDVVFEIAMNGLPENQTAFVKLVLDWFTENGADGKIPDASTVWKRCSRIWWRLVDKA